MVFEPFYRRQFSHLPTLQTAHLILRPVRRHDAEAMYAYARDADVSRYVLWEPHRSISDTRETISDIRRQYRHGWPSSFAIALKDTDRMIGSIGFMWLNPENRSAEIGYSLGKEHWNRGYMTEALTELIRFSFVTLRLHRLEAQHDIRNPASGRVMQKAGMQYEGTLRDRFRNKGSYCTVALYSIINPIQDQEK